MFIRVMADCEECVTATEFIIPEEVSSRADFDASKYIAKVLKARGWRSYRKNGKVYWSCLQCEKAIHQWGKSLVRKNKSRRKHRV